MNDPHLRVRPIGLLTAVVLWLLVLGCGSGSAASPVPESTPAESAFSLPAGPLSTSDVQTVAHQASGHPIWIGGYKPISYDPAVGAKIFDPICPERSPFSMHVNGWMEMKYYGFSRSQDVALDQNGNTVDLENRNTFGFPRMQLRFTGTLLDPNIFYSLGFFGTTTSNITALPTPQIGYKFSDALSIAGGITQTATVWEYNQGHLYQFGSERSMATTFMRGNNAVGVVFTGKLFGDRLSYFSTITNGFNGQIFNVNRTSVNLAYGCNTQYQLIGDWGAGFSDWENHPSSAVRVGGYIGVAPNDEAELIENQNSFSENTIYRLSNGFILGAPDALGAGVRIVTTDVFVASMNAGWKRRGSSLNGEFIWRNFSDFTTIGGPPNREILQQRGGYLYAGQFVVPQCTELGVRTGYTDGEFGSGWEIGGNFNHFIKGSRNARFVAEVIYVEDSPADNVNTVYQAFHSGTSLQLEFYLRF